MPETNYHGPAIIWERKYFQFIFASILVVLTYVEQDLGPEARTVGWD